MKYLVSHLGEQFGPFSAPEIVARVSARELDVLDYAFDESRGDWVLLTELDEVAALLKARKPAAPPKPAGARPPAAESTPSLAAAHAIAEWFVLKGESKFGPFGHDELVGLLQQKIVYPFDYCWTAGFDAWMRVGEVAEFSSERTRELMKTNVDVFIPRRFERRAYGATVILHDNQRAWRGVGRELSSGGVGVRVRGAATIVPGQTLNLHCAAHDGLPAFNATCEVVAIQAGPGDASLEYGLRFVSLGADARASINVKVA